MKMILTRRGSSGLHPAVAVLSVLLMLVGAVALSIGPAGAEEPPTAYCSQVQQPSGPVPGDLVVYAYGYCNLDYDVAGSVIVQAGADLDIGAAAIAGHVNVGRNASVTFGGGAGVGGYVALDHAAGVSMYGTTVGGSIVGSVAPGGGIVLRAATVLGRLAISGTGPGATVNSKALLVGGDIILDGVRVALLDYTGGGGQLILRHVHDGSPLYSSDGVEFTSSVVCGGNVPGNLVVENSTGTVAIGAGSVCRAQEEGLTIEGSLLAHDNTASIFVGGIVGGDVACWNNTHHPRGDLAPNDRTRVQVDGHRLGQCRHLPRP